MELAPPKDTESQFDLIQRIKQNRGRAGFSGRALPSLGSQPAPAAMGGGGAAERAAWAGRWPEEKEQAGRDWP